jgi:nicotinamide-nucleotide amidase
MNAVILTVGDELLIGQVVNSNAAWLGEQLNLIGADVLRSVTVGDDIPAIRAALHHAFDEADLVLVTGGLGPTHDDVTREAIGRFFGLAFHFDEAVYAHIQTRFTRRGTTAPETNRVQAMVPEGFEVLPNPVGTAPGLWYQFGRDGHVRYLGVLPGVPHEMKYLVEHEVSPRILQDGNRRTILHRTLHTTGIGESHLQDRIGDLSGFLGPDLRLAYLPGTSGVRLRLTATAPNRTSAEALLNGLHDHLRDRIGTYIFDEQGSDLEAVVGELLRSRGLTLAVAESCTGGLVSNRFTNISGASAYFKGCIVAYCNDVKADMLGVRYPTLDEEGAVSEAVALQMAHGVRERLHADIGVSSTGVMGPLGGSPDKPVGTVWIAYADPEHEEAVQVHFQKDRLSNKELTSTAVLNLVRKHLLRRNGR